jgi:hypothetical protein
MFEEQHHRILILLTTNAVYIHAFQPQRKEIVKISVSPSKSKNALQPPMRYPCDVFWAIFLQSRRIMEIQMSSLS